MEDKVDLFENHQSDNLEKNNEGLDNKVNMPLHEQEQDQSPVKNSAVRKSNRSRKTPVHLSEAITDAHAVGESIQKRLLKTAMVNSQKHHSASKLISKPKLPFRQTNPYPDFRCDHCGSRYVVNPMRRGNKVSFSKYKAAPRHKIDPETQKILTLCNACGLKFGRQKKGKRKEEISIEEQKKFIEEGERFAKELGLKLENPAAARLFCSNMTKSACGCIQKYICVSETANVDEILNRGKELLELLMEAMELKKQKCYELPVLEEKGAKKSSIKVGLGNGHRKSKEFEVFVLTKRIYLREQLKFCEKGTQKILCYSNNFLHKRMKTDPEKGVRVERQKGKAALGMLKPIQDLPLEACCVDNCVRMALTHGRLLEVWRQRAASSQVEARRVLAEMLTPSGGNRANCYRFVSLVTGCSNTTIGKVNDQMKSTGGDREPPEHGLKRYRKENPPVKKNTTPQPTFVPSYQILQTAANSAGLSTMMQDINGKLSEPLTKKTKRGAKSKSDQKSKKASAYTPLSNTYNIVTDNSEHTTNVQNISAAVLSLNSNYQNGGFISIPAGLTAANTIAIPNGVSLQTAQHHLQQQQLQLQIQLLQQQLQTNQTASITHQATDTPEFVVAVTHPMEHSVQQVATPVVVQSVTTQPIVHNVAAQSILPNAVQNEGVLSTLVTNAAGLNFVSASGNVNLLHQHQSQQPQQQQSQQNSEGTRANLSLLTSSMTNTGEIGIITPNHTVNVLTPQTNITDNAARPTRAIESFRQVHLITSQSPTMAISQPVTISLQNPTISLSNLPTMLLTQASSNEQQQQQLLIQPTSNPQQTSEQLIIQRPLISQSASDQIVMHQSLPTTPSNSEQSVAMTTTVLPPMSSFNADAFLTGDGSTTYTVINSGTISRLQQRQGESESQPEDIQVSFCSLNNAHS